MTSKLTYDGKVVVITGAGGGLGRTYALAFAERGAKVVVNDLGGTLGGSGNSTKAAETVVEEIKAKGGIAVPNFDNVVTNPEGIIKTAVEAFGTVHVLVNNAGILKDSSFKNMTDKQFQDVLDVHLNGAYKLTHAAWGYFKKQNYGRIVNTCSPAGLYGNFGQANYSAAKLALVGFAETLAKEGHKNNIKANTIAPLARSRMTESILPPDMLEKLGPEKVTPLVLYLSHESNPSSGAIYEVAAGFYGQIRWERSQGVLFKPNESFTPEAILNRYSDIVSFKGKNQYPIMLNDYNTLIEKSTNLPKDNDQGKVKITSLKDKVVVITGAGAGLGRSHALWFAKYGAKVVVNDFADPGPVVQEITKAGGTAVGSKHDVVTQPDQVIKTALDKFGRVDILVNNAGILRDRSFQKMSDKEWDQVVNIHLVATFKLCKLVWPIFLKQQSGHIINTTSTSGIYGNFGQANYASAKLGVLGLSRTLAIEGKKAGIKVNVIAPHAETAMTKTIFSEKELNKFSPSQVSPFVVLLSSDELNVTGQLFEVGAGWIGNTRWQRAKGAISHDKVTQVEFIRDNWKDIVDFSQPITVASTQESAMAIMESIGGGDDDDEDEDDDDENEDTDEALSSYKYTHKDVILYNLSLGATAKELKYSYENSQDFQVLPTFGTIPFMVQDNGGLDMPGLLKNFNPMMLLHGEHYLRICKFPIPTEGEVETKSYPIATLNKGKNGLIIGGYETVNKKGETLFYNEGSFFVRGSQTQNGKDTFLKERTKFATLPFEAPKDRKPDFDVTFQTSVDQAALYRLNADFNPLHIDPAFAKGAQFPKPILHGLCSLGTSLKRIYEHYGAFEELKVRFASFVFPGDRLRVVGWKDGSIVTFQVYDVDRKVLVISNAGINLRAKPKL
ncbi:unnamed protein product [Kuraishia capsulata CBS 1993]|uniref:Peroxisomal hydratase-dehydrogenase-epimerase n=1 Tax=Kuraishia capsulata CBS 1993 TaxID=1382522 RepID=W6MI18_9ASCO|nr:uncharacterized protein KUCA_T00001711001 [Kuraishia capsulata CBS 1993]CDK25741.1 unnamed protein product [Kuraishia capsulata CBS 1993]